MLTPGHLYLTGFRGTGKTSVGQRLTQALSMPLVDLDQSIEESAGQSIRQIFQRGGEPLFRDLETAALTKVAAESTPHIISLGGGAVLKAENRALIGRTGKCVWLDASAESICDRIFSDSSTIDRRPSLTELSPRDEVSQLLGQRRSIYQSAADYRIDTDGKSIDQVASEIERLFGGNSIQT